MFIILPPTIILSLKICCNSEGVFEKCSLQGIPGTKCCKCPVLVVRHPYTAKSGVVGGTVLVGTTSLCLHQLP